MSQREEIEMARWQEIQKLRREVESKDCSWFWLHPLPKPVSGPEGPLPKWDNVGNKWILPKGDLR